MVGIGELIEQGAPHYAVRFCKFLQVFGKRFRVAGNVQDAAVAFHQFERGRVKAGARRVDEYGAELETAQVDALKAAEGAHAGQGLGDLFAGQADQCDVFHSIDLQVFLRRTNRTLCQFGRQYSAEAGG